MFPCMGSIALIDGRSCMDVGGLGENVCVGVVFDLRIARFANWVSFYIFYSFLFLFFIIIISYYFSFSRCYMVGWDGDWPWFI